MSLLDIGKNLFQKASTGVSNFLQQYPTPISYVQQQMQPKQVVSPIPQPVTPTDNRGIWATPVRRGMVQAQKTIQSPPFQQALQNGVPWFNPLNPFRGYTEQLLPTALQTGVNAGLEKITGNPMTFNLIPQNTLQGYSSSGPLGKAQPYLTGGLQTLNAGMGLAMGPTAAANPLGFAKSLLAFNTGLQGTGALAQGIREKQPIKEIGKNIAEAIIGKGKTSGPFGGIFGDNVLTQAADLTLALGLPLVFHGKTNEITTYKKDTLGRLHDAGGLYVEGDKPVKPPKMPTAQWNFQLEFNKKYGRNPYEPVFPNDLEKALKIEAEKRIGMQVRSKGADVIQSSPTGVGGVPEGVTGKAKLKGLPQIEPLAQPSLQTNPLASGEQPPVGKAKIRTVQTPTSPDTLPNSIPRGFTTSVQEAPKVMKKVKKLVDNTYVPKPNKQLMGEAQALLQSGAKIDLKRTENVDQKIAATIQEAVNQQKKNPQAAANLYNNLSERGTELGRGVQAFSLLDKMSPEAIALSAAGKIKKYNMTAIRKIPELTGAQVKLIGDKVSALDGLTVGSREHGIAVNELANTVNNFIPSSLVDKALTVWKAGLLTSLRTHERNLLGNTIMYASEVVKDIPATIADIGMSAVTGKRTLTPTLQGAAGGATKGAQAAKDVTLLGYDPQEAISKFDVHRVTWGNNPVEQFLKKATDAVYRPLAAEDKVFWHSAFARSLYDQAGAEAMNAGKKGNKAFIENLVHNPTVEIGKTALNDANYATFHDKSALSGIANGIKNAAKNIPGAGGELGKVVTEVLAPFTGVPSSIVGKTLAYSPIGLIKGAINTGRVLAGSVPELQRQAAQEIGRGVVGTGLFGLGAYLMNKGLMTGQPKDPKEADLWQAQGKQANSVLVNGKWRSINSIGPQNLVVLAGAKYQEETGKSDGSMGAYAGGLAKDQLSQTFLAGVQGPLNAITDPARYGQSYIGNQASSLIPNIVKDTSKAFDPNAREVHGVGDYVKQSIPGVRNQLLPKRDVLGNIVSQEPTGINAFFDLFNSKTPIDNQVVSELSRLAQSGNEATPSKLTTNQTILKQKVKLTFDQLNTLESRVGEALRPQLQSLVISPAYQSLDDELKAQAIDKIVQSVRDKYKIVNTNSITSGGTQAPIQQGVMVPIVNKNGNVTMIDTSFQPTSPEITGLTELDKKSFTKFNGEITQKANDIYDLYKAGNLTQDEANTQLSKLKDLKSQYAAPKTAKKISISKVSVSKIKIVTPKKSKTLNFKIASSPKLKMAKLKSKKTSQIKPIKIAKLKGLAKSKRLV